MSSPIHDVVVVGGGPAGAALAVHLCRRGHHVVLLEKARLPRPKPCGEALSPGATPLLAELGVLERLRGEVHGALAGFAIFPYDHAPFRGTYAARSGGDPDRAVGLTIPRLRLDRVLLDAAGAAGADVREGWMVHQVSEWEDRARLVRGRDAQGQPFTLRARLLIGADGVHSTVARRLDLARPSRRLRQVAIVTHMRGVAGLGTYGEMHVAPGGYCGIAPLGGDLANVAIVVPAGRYAHHRDTETQREDAEGYSLAHVGLHPAAAGVVPSIRSQPEARTPQSETPRVLRFFHAESARYPHLAGRLDGARIVAGPWTTSGLARGVRRRVDDGLLLVGDAGGYFDPFTGEGLYRGMRAAVLAAETADAALRAGDARRAALAPYARRYAREFAPKRLVELIVHEVITRRTLFEHIAERLRRRTGLADALEGVTGDFLSPYEVLSPLYLARLLI